MNTWVFLASFGVGLFIASVVFRDTPWGVPLVVGGFAAFVAALYQRWWLKAVFDDGSGRKPARRMVRTMR